MNQDLLRSLPAPVATFVRAVNTADIEELSRCFAARAMVNDQLHEYWDAPAIKEWATRDLIGQHIRITPQRVVINHGHTVVDVSIDGSFDKRGLPDPLIVTFYFSSNDFELTQLVILRNERDV
jgi:hypothetical protein